MFYIKQHIHTYEQILDGTKYMYFYDIYIKSWTIYKVNDSYEQINEAEHYANKNMLLKHYKLNFKIKTSK